MASLPSHRHLLTFPEAGPNRASRRLLTSTVFLYPSPAPETLSSRRSVKTTRLLPTKQERLLRTPATGSMRPGPRVNSRLGSTSVGSPSPSLAAATNWSPLSAVTPTSLQQRPRATLPLRRNPPPPLRQASQTASSMRGRIRNSRPGQIGTASRSLRAPSVTKSSPLPARISPS